jgi:hypothetical protein
MEENNSTKLLGTVCQNVRSNYPEYQDLGDHDDDDDDGDDNGNNKDIIMSACPGLVKEHDRIRVCIFKYTLIFAMK